MKANRHKVAIIGASGYTGEELVKLLLRHPDVELVAVTSRQYAGKPLADPIPAVRGLTDLIFSTADLDSVLKAKPEVAFLALPHGVSAEYAPHLLKNSVKVIDLSADFRLRSAAVYEEFYWTKHPLPELLKEAV